MDYTSETPFDSIESAQQFIELLEEAIGEARREVDADIASDQPERRLQALQLVSYKLAKLSVHIASTQRILNDLRSLRRLLLNERAYENDGEPPEQGRAALLGE